MYDTRKTQWSNMLRLIRELIKYRLWVPAAYSKRIAVIVGAPALILIFGSLSLANAETVRNNAIFGDWVIACASLADIKEASGLKCIMSQRVEFQDTSETLLQLDLYLNPENGQAEAIFILPLGIPLTSSPILLFNNSTRLALAISHCHGDGCYFKAPLNKPLLEAFLSMQSATIKLTGNNNEAVNIPVSGKGSRAAHNYFEALPKD
ncbi:MAG: invasion protein IalB [Arenicella sp.]|jgi:invasion protein IalB